MTDRPIICDAEYDTLAHAWVNMWEAIPLSSRRGWEQPWPTETFVDGKRAPERDPIFSAINDDEQRAIRVTITNSAEVKAAPESWIEYCDGPNVIELRIVCWNNAGAIAAVADLVRRWVELGVIAWGWKHD